MSPIKLIVKYILAYSPQWIKIPIRSVLKKIEIRNAIKRQKRTKVSKAYIHKIINNLQLDCDVMLHTSKINIGELEGGTEFTAKEILNKVDIQHHTLLVSALPYRGSFADYLKKNIIFDVRTAPIAMGAINKYIASFPNAERSIHPTHSVVAIGKDAKYYTEDHQLDETPFGLHSPYFKLIKNKGKVLLFGATLNNLTCICAIEDMLGEPYADFIYSPKKYKIECVNQNGTHFYVNTRCHDPRKAIKRSLLFIHDDLISKGIMKTYPIGEAEVSVIDIYKFAIYYLKLLDSGHSNRGKIKISAELHRKIEQTLSELNRL